jgi:hypothetical protein
VQPIPERTEFLSTFFASWHSESSCVPHSFHEDGNKIKYNLNVTFIQLPLINHRMLLIS